MVIDIARLTTETENLVVYTNTLHEMNLSALAPAYKWDSNSLAAFLTYMSKLYTIDSSEASVMCVTESLNRRRDGSGQFAARIMERVGGNFSVLLIPYLSFLGSISLSSKGAQSVNIYHNIYYR